VIAAVAAIIFFVPPVRAYFEQGMQDLGLMERPPLE
jgi:hypothetical protein